MLDSDATYPDFSFLPGCGLEKMNMLLNISGVIKN